MTLTEKLQSKTQEFKANMEAAQTAEKAKITAKVDELRQKAEQSKEAVSSRITDGKNSFRQKLEGIKESVQQKKEELKGKVDGMKQQAKADIADWNADDAEAYAAMTLDVALSYIDEAQAAAVQAVSARMKANEAAGKA